MVRGADAWGWPVAPQFREGEFEAKYLWYCGMKREHGEVPASREVVLEEARRGFSGVSRLLEESVLSVRHTVPRKEET